MIQFQGIRKRFGAVQVLDGIDLTIRSGRVTAILCENGQAVEFGQPLFIIE